MSKVLAVGDIHQKEWIIDKVSTIIEKYDKVVFVGDYADDFNSNPHDRIFIWKKMKNFKEQFQSKVELSVGNHDYVYLYKEYAGRYTGWNNIAQSLLNSDIELKNWLIDIPLSINIDGITYSHAGFTKQWLESHQTPLDYDGPLWVRPQDKIEYIENQVFGHTPSRTCWEVQPNVWCIDTFSTYKDGKPYGDGTVLEIINGKIFNKIIL